MTSHHYRLGFSQTDGSALYCSFVGRYLDVTVAVTSNTLNTGHNKSTLVVSRTIFTITLCIFSKSLINMYYL